MFSRPAGARHDLKGFRLRQNKSLYVYYIYCTNFRSRYMIAYRRHNGPVISHMRGAFDDAIAPSMLDDLQL